MKTMYFLDLNGTVFEVDHDGNLLDYLREEARLTSVKNGCAEGACGACMILIDGKPTRACLFSIAKAEGKKLLTIEGFTQREKDVYAWAFAVAGAVQCGFCIPGMVISAKGLLDVNPLPTRDEIRRGIRGNICRCTGYQKIVDAIEKAADAFRTGFVPPPLYERAYEVGERMPRLDARDKTLGIGEYVEDMVMPGMLYGSALRPPAPRILVKAIETGAAKKVPGVHAVLTAEDIPGDRYQGHLKHDWPVMVAEGEESRYIGDALALVAAESKAAMKEALALIELEYEELPPVLTIDEALSADAPPIHPDGNRLSVNAKVLRGDVEAALANSKHVVSKSFYSPPVEHAFMEPESSLAYIDENGTVVVYVADQGIYDDLHGITGMLGLTEKEVRVISRLVGGGFGGKEDLSVQHHAALLAWHTKRPVRVTLTRDESIRIHPKRHPMYLDYTMGCDGEGHITAARIRIKADTGAYASLGGPVLQRACTHATGPYRIPNVDIEGVGAFTNNPPSGAFRGFGVTQSAFAVEQMVNLLAEAVGISYWEIRDRNVIVPGDVMGNGQIAAKNTKIRETLHAAKPYFDESPYAGIACGLKNSGLGVGVPDVGRVRLEVENGGIRIYTSAACIGQGLGSTLVQIASHTTGLPVAAISFAEPDTWRTPNSGTTTASRQTLFTGEATRMCCAQFVEELAAAGGDISKLEGRTYYNEFTSPTDPMGSDKPNPVSHVAYGYATHVCILDEEGRVSKYVACHDVGQAINPDNVEGQIHGGVAMGLGYALTEDLRLEGGVPKAKLGTLGIWRSTEMPEIESVIMAPIDEAPGEFAYGAKGVGEIVLVPPAPAIALAYRRFDGKFRSRLPLDDTPYSRKKTGSFTRPKPTKVPVEPELVPAGTK